VVGEILTAFLAAWASCPAYFVYCSIERTGLLWLTFTFSRLLRSMAGQTPDAITHWVGDAHLSTPRQAADGSVRPHLAYAIISVPLSSRTSTRDVDLQTLSRTMTNDA